MQMIVFCGVLFIVSLVANVITDYLFDGRWFFQKPEKEIGQFLLSRFFRALVFGAIIALLVRGNHKKTSEDS